MEIECAFAMANTPVRLPFLAMERSLRATGFDLPLKVFPFDDRRFDLPPNASWLRAPLHDWLDANKANHLCYKYYCLTQSSYFFTDIDVIFLRDPRIDLQPLSGFVVADTELVKPRYTFTKDSEPILARRTSIWLNQVFNSGHFACDRVLYTDEEFHKACETPEVARPTLCDDQTGFNLLVALANVPVTNLNLPPRSMESTWAGDYPGEFEHLWKDPQKKPYFMHWAGPVLDDDRPVNSLFYEFLTAAELAEWREQQRIRLEKARRAARWPLGVRALKALVQILYPRFRVQFAGR